MNKVYTKHELAGLNNDRLFGMSPSIGWIKTGLSGINSEKRKKK
jgi:hypothetical protein